MANAVAWVGQDGNLWYKSGQGVQNWGNANQYQFTQGGISAVGGTNTPLSQGPGFAPGVDQINDPAQAASAPAPSAPSSNKPLNAAAVSNTQLTIDQIPALLAAALGSEDTTHSNTVAGFDAAQAGQQKTYDTSTTTNQQNYDSNFMDSIRAGIKGLGGLMQLLRGSGAAGGSVDKTVRDVVGGTTANDIRGGADTQQANQTTLDSSLGTFLTDLKGKRQAAEDTYTNNKSAIQRDSNTQLQDLYGKMAGYYGDSGNTGAADDWLGRAGALTPSIAADSKTQVSPYDTTPVAVQAPQLTAFAGPTQPSVLAAPQDGQVGSGIFTLAPPRKQQTAPVGV